MSALVNKLTVVHHKLDDRVRQELNRRFRNGIRVLRLKTLMLVVKDRLHMLTRFPKRGRD